MTRLLSLVTYCAQPAMWSGYRKFYNEVMPPIDVERMANSVDPDQTAP